MGHKGTSQTEEGRKKGQTTEMSKRPCKESQRDDAEKRRCCSPRTPKPLTGLVPHSANSPARQRYLYLVLEDWKRGYSIHRLGEGDFEPDAPVDARPAEYPLVRVQAQPSCSHSGTFAAHGSKILAMHPAVSSPGIPVFDFDTETLELAVYPFPRSRTVMCGSTLVHTSVGDRLVSFVFRHLEVLGPVPPSPTDESWSWSWTRVEPLPPFDSSHVSSYALHPDGRTIFMSVKGWSSSTRTLLDTRNSTFTFDTERLEWTHLGEWLLPFKGRAHYDRELDAWVGICRFEEGAGHLCCCDVPPAVGCKTMPAWKLGKDLLFDKGSIRHSGATLVYMGDSRFCLIESQVPEHYQPLRVLAITSFGLKYDKVGELVTTQYRAHASISYQSAHKQLGLDLDPVAFWM